MGKKLFNSHDGHQLKPDKKSEDRCRYNKQNFIEDEGYIRENSILSVGDDVIYPHPPNNNNYINQNKKIKISILIDIINFNIHSYNIHLLLKYLINDPFSSVFNIIYKKDMYGNLLIQFQLKLDNNTYSLTLVDKPSSLFYPNTLLIKYPDQASLLYLEKFLYRIKYHIQKVEFTFDFEGSNNKQILKQIFKLYYLKWSTKSTPLTLKYATTRYSNNIRKSPRGIKVYSKTRKNGTDVVRMEMTYKRSILNRYKIKNIKDLINLDAQKIAKPISFRKFDYDKYMNLHLKQLNTGTAISYGYMKKPMVSEANLLKETIGILIDTTNIDYAAGIKKSKESIEYDLFIKHPFEDHFKNKLIGKSFLQHDYISVDEDILFAE